MDTVANAAAINALGGVYNAIAYPCVLAYVKIPEGTANTNVALNGLAYQNHWCGSDLGNTVTPPIVPSVASAITCKSQELICYNVHTLSLAARTPFTLGVWTTSAAQNAGPANSGFSLDYTQVGRESEMRYKY